MADITIFLPISRPDRVARMIEQINTLEVTPFLDINVLVIIDNPFILPFETRYPTNCVQSGFNPTAEMDVKARRQKIADIFNLAQRYIPKDTKYVFTLEDDTEVKNDVLMKLCARYTVESATQRIGFVSGIQVGRWGFKCLGVWEFDNALSPTKFKSSRYQQFGKKKVSACGFYCFLTTRESFCQVRHKPFENILGPDVNFGLELQKLGYSNYADFEIITGHDDKIRTFYPNENTIVVEYVKENDQWVRISPDGKTSINK